MDIATALLPAEALVATWACALCVLAWAAWRAPWSRFASSEAVHVWYGTIFALTLLWSLRATVAGVVIIHLLGITVFALTAGAPLALIGGALVVLAVALTGGLPLANAAAVFLVSVVLPVGVTGAVLRAAERHLPPNFFVYVFVAAFLGSALSFGAAGLAAASVLVATDAAPADVVFGEYVPYLLYLAFGEATLTGMVVTLLVVYRPGWVATFDDARYLERR
jgi:uncharacterized membrane protein